MLVIVKKSHTSFTIFYFIIAMNCGSWQYLSSHFSFRSHSVLLLIHELFGRNREWIESLCWIILGLRSIKFHIFSVCSTRHEMALPSNDKSQGSFKTFFNFNSYHNDLVFLRKIYPWTIRCLAALKITKYRMFTSKWFRWFTAVISWNSWIFAIEWMTKNKYVHVNIHTLIHYSSILAKWWWRWWWWGSFCTLYLTTPKPNISKVIYVSEAYRR